MTCKEFQESLSTYLDRELPAPDAQLMMAHAETCARCRKERTLWLELKSVVRDQSMPGIPADLIAAIEEKTILRPVWWESESFRGRWFPLLVGLTTAAGALGLSRLQEHSVPRGVLPVVSAPTLKHESAQAFLPHPEELNQEKGERREHEKS